MKNLYFVPERVRERSFNLIGRSYSSISLETVMSMSGLSREAALQACRDRKWQINTDGVTINPTPPAQPAPPHTSSEDQLFKLTDFVSFLENWGSHFWIWFEIPSTKFYRTRLHNIKTKFYILLIFIKFKV